MHASGFRGLDARTRARSVQSVNEQAPAHTTPAGGTRQTREKPLFLAPGGRSGDGHGYANVPYMAMSHEPECVGPAILDGYREAASFHRTQQHVLAVTQARVARPQLHPAARITDIERRAKDAHRNLTGELHVMRQILQRAQRGNRKPPQALITRIERAEASLDGVPLAA